MAENSKLTGIELNGVLYSLGKSIYEELDISLVRFAELLGRDFYCPTLSSAPTSSTLSYTDTDGESQSFQIGQPCRWAEGNNWRLAVCTNNNGSASSWYVLPVKVSELTNDAGYLTSHQDISHLATKTEVSGKVDKVSGKQLSTEDFTTALKNKLNGLSNYDDTTISNAVSSLQTQLNTLVSGNPSTAINSFNEIIAFLEGITDSEDLESIIASIEQQIAAKQDKISDLDTIRSGAAKGATALQSVPPEFITETELQDKGFATRVELSTKQNKLLKFTNKVASTWVSDTTMPGFSYRCDIACEGVTEEMYPEVVLFSEQASSGDYAPVSESKDGYVSIWSKKNISVTIPTIVVTT